MFTSFIIKAPLQSTGEKMGLLENFIQFLDFKSYLL